MSDNEIKILDRDKTLIGALASHDNIRKNRQLAEILDSTVERNDEKIKEFAFVFTGGTFDRLFRDSLCEGQQPGDEGPGLKKQTKEFLLKECGVIRLPKTTEGGVILLSYLVSQRLISLLWTFLTPLTAHFLNAENLALLRLADHCRAKKLINCASVREWIEHEADRDKDLNKLQPSTEILLGDNTFALPTTIRPLHDNGPEVLGSYVDVRWKRNEDGVRDQEPDDESQETQPGSQASDSIQQTTPSNSNQLVIALISHDEMKSRMQDFVADHERKLNHFHRILATGTTGKLVEDAAPLLKKNGLVHRYHSGPKGGDIEIAAEVLAGTCNVVVFFVDPLSAHPHSDDIRVIFGACMIEDNVVVLTNEVQARNWMSRRNP